VSDLFSIDGKTALVTGRTRDQAMIIEGTSRPGNVYISSRKREVCDEVAAELSKIGTCVSLPADLSDEPPATSWRWRSPSASSLHVLVNNTEATWGAPSPSFTGAWDKVLDLNVKAPSFSPALLPLLEAAATLTISR
jgi:NAD(P)-dependent dehydrogenase (short-subunit alcohol dehydrogenase family)